jgi:hypothetical protein
VRAAALPQILLARNAADIDDAFAQSCDDPPELHLLRLERECGTRCGKPLPNNFKPQLSVIQASYSSYIDL